MEETIDTNDLFEGDLINIGQKPKSESWKILPLFKEGNLGEIRVWQIGFDAKSNNLKMIHGSLITSKGESGKLTIAYHPIEINKSGRSIQEQALLEARKRYLDSYKGGYLPKGEELPPDLNGKEPMLAKTLKLSSDTSSCKSNEIRLTKYPVNVMPKYDGIRALSRLVNGNIQMRSRNNKEHESPLTHIKNDLSIFLKYLPVNSELDGELYSMKMSFNELSGVIRTKNRIHPKHDLVNYYIFDLIEPRQMCWEDRYRVLVEAYEKYIADGNPFSTFIIVQSYTANSEKELLEYHTKFITEGYEGIIIRRYAQVEVNKCCSTLLNNGRIDDFCNKCKKAYSLTVYRTTRSNALLKYKLFTDEEVKIIGFEKSVGNQDGAVIFKVLDSRGNEFTVVPRGTVDYRRELFNKGNSLIGKPLTIRYQELSDYSVPRFPTAIAIRDYE